MKFKNSKLYGIIQNMPPLYHKLPGEDYDIQKSRVLWWLVKQPELLEYIWNKIKQSGAVKYNSDTGKWQGVHFREEEDD